MKNSEKFEGFKNKLVQDNENKYGKEIRNKYGNEFIDQTNKNIKNMSEDDYKDISSLENEIKVLLKEAFKTNDPRGELAQEVVKLHRKWIIFYWNDYSKEAHVNLAEMYVNDDRFKSYYDSEKSGTANFLKDAILAYTENL